MITIDQRNKLREAANALPGALWLPWSVQTSNSFRRIGTDRGDGNVLCAVTQRSDGHPDLHAPSGILDYIVAAHPRVVIDLLDDLEEIQRALKRLRHDLATCHQTFDGGHRDEATREIFHDGMETVRKVVEAALTPGQGGDPS